MPITPKTGSLFHADSHFAQSTFGSGSKADRALQTPFVALSLRAAKSRGFMIQPVRTCTGRTVDIALGIDRYDFAVRVDFEDGRPVARVERLA
jgi:hypothetical protein